MTGVYIMSNNKKPYIVTTQSASSFINNEGDVVNGQNLVVGKGWEQTPNKEGTNPFMEIRFDYLVQAMMKQIPHYKNKKGEIVFRDTEVTGTLSVWNPKEES
tara:strand:- start:1706 stop:2011 length:306 start_codon:yes stop_codon:yes gene_type:complete